MPNNYGKDDLAYRLQRTIFRLGRELRTADSAAALSPAELLLLSAIRLQPGAGVSDLARDLRVGRSVVSEQVSKLAAAGLVRRHDLVDPSDRRRVGLSLTPLGLEAFAAAAERRRQWLARRMDRLTPEDRDVLQQAVALLDGITDATMDTYPQTNDHEGTHHG